MVGRWISFWNGPCFWVDMLISGVHPGNLTYIDTFVKRYLLSILLISGLHVNSREEKNHWKNPSIFFHVTRSFLQKQTHFLLSPTHFPHRGAPHTSIPRTTVPKPGNKSPVTFQFLWPNHHGLIPAPPRFSMFWRPRNFLGGYVSNALRD